MPSRVGRIKAIRRGVGRIVGFIHSGKSKAEGVERR